MSCLLVWLPSCALQVRWNCLFIPEVCVGKCWEKVLCCSVPTQKAWAELSAEQVWQCEHRPCLLCHVLVQMSVLLSGNTGVRGKLSCSGKALQPAKLPEDIRNLLKVRLYLSVWHCNTDELVHFQVALLDFGATRGFDEKFTDVYIEVRTCSVS